ncbi:MAG: hypothetical protein ACYC92_14895 [Candidatus Acidiferrales bacterium]
MNLGPPSSGSSPLDSDRLDSWKEIALHLKRDVRTAQRWEVSEGLPVYRHQHGKNDSVYAYKSEVDSWWASRRPAVQKQDPGKEDVQKLELHKQHHEKGQRDFDLRIQPSLPRSLRFFLCTIMIIVTALAVQEVRRLLQEHFASDPFALTGMQTLAVLPFRNISSDLDPKFALGVTDDVTHDLREVGTLHVMGITSTMPFQNTSEPPGQIARQLHANKVLLGTVTRFNGQIHIAAQLIDGPTGQLLWAQQFDRNDTDLPSAETDVASAIATAVETLLLPENPHALAPARLSKPGSPT